VDVDQCSTNDRYYDRTECTIGPIDCNPSSPGLEICCDSVTEDCCEYGGDPWTCVPTGTCSGTVQPGHYCPSGECCLLDCDGEDGCHPYGNGCEHRDYYPVTGGCDYSYSNRHTDSCDGWGSNYCYDNDVYTSRVCHDYYCDGGTCSDHPSTESSLVEDCGEDYCDGWGDNYCVGHEVWHSRTCHDLGCSAGSCFDITFPDSELVEACDCWEYCDSGTCIDFRPTLTGCNYYDYCWDDDCDWGTECYTASTDPVQIDIISETCKDDSYTCNEPMTCPYKDTPPPGS
jgi:hypothetical protein